MDPVMSDLIDGLKTETGVYPALFDDMGSSQLT